MRRSQKKSSGSTGQQKPGVGDRIQDALVTAADLRKAMHAVDALSPEDRGDFTARVIALMKAFGLMTGKESEPNDERHRTVAKVTAVQIRMEAMARLIGKERFRPWTMESGQDGMTFISEYFLEVAATAPILGGNRGKQNYFDEEDFARRILEVSKEEGRA